MENQKKEYDPEKAFKYFIENSSFKIFTDNGISCITILAILNQDIDSPYSQIRSNDLEENVDKILIKFFIREEYEGNKKIIKDSLLRDNEVNNGEIEVTRKYEIENEVNIQKDIYFKSLKDDFLEPVCPSILYSESDNIEQYKKEWLKYNIISRFTDRPFIINRPNKPEDLQIIKQLFTYDISIIVMEFMDGYTTLGSVIDSKKLTDDLYSKYMTLATYELKKIHKYGYYHGDYHFGNMMINPNYKYLSLNDKKWYGKLIIIDFGRTYKLPENMNREELFKDDLYYILSYLNNNEKNTRNFNNQLYVNIIKNLNFYNYLRLLFDVEIKTDITNRVRKRKNSNISFDEILKKIESFKYYGGKKLKNNNSIFYSIKKEMNENNEENEIKKNMSKEELEVYEFNKRHEESIKRRNSEYYQRMTNEIAEKVRESGFGLHSLEKYTMELEKMVEEESKKERHGFGDELIKSMENLTYDEIMEAIQGYVYPPTNEPKKC